MGYGLMLPAIAVLHVRHRRSRDSGTILATIAGTAAVSVGLVASLNVDLRPAALFLLGMWWWTIGKTWAETRLFGRYLGPATQALGALALVVAFAEGANVLAVVFFPGFPGVDVWMLARIALGVWLVVVAMQLRLLAPPSNIA